MPKRDGTGPMGKGRMTGRGQGACNPAGGSSSDNKQGRRNLGGGSEQTRGSGQGRGSGKGRGNK